MINKLEPNMHIRTDYGIYKFIGIWDKNNNQFSEEIEYGVEIGSRNIQIEEYKLDAFCKKYKFSHNLIDLIEAKLVEKVND